MVFGISGTHRSGKTTLAKDLSSTLDIKFYETKSFEVLKKHGINPIEVNSIDDRIKMQNILLDNHIENLQKLPRPLITDRTPLDYYAYLIAEVNMHNLTEEQMQEVFRYRQRCIAAIRSNYACIHICTPLPEYEEREDKPPMNIAYQYKINDIIMGIMNDYQISSVVNRVVLNSKNRIERLEFSIHNINQIMGELFEAKQKLTLH